LIVDRFDELSDAGAGVGEVAIGGFLQGFKVTAESAPHGTKAGDPVWRLPLAAGADRTLTYTVSFNR